MIVGRFPRPRELNPRLPQPLEAICLKAMALDPARRYHSARELADDVEAWLADEPVAAWREPRWSRAGRWMRRHRSLVTGLAAVMLMALAGFSFGLVLLAAANERVRRSQHVAVRAKQSGEALYRIAVLLATAAQAAAKDTTVSQADRDRLGEKYAAAAVNMLKEARSAGCFADPARRREFQEEAALRIRPQRKDYRELIEQIGPR